MTAQLRTTLRTHTARAYCLDPECEFTKATTSRVSDAAIRYAAQEHAKATGHTTQAAILDRTEYGPQDGALAS